MENQNYEKKQGGTLESQNPPPYSEIQPSFPNQQYPLVAGPAPSMGFAANPAMPPQYPSYAPYGVFPDQGPLTQPPLHTSFFIPAQPTHEPDYLAYSIFTMLCCCLPLGIAALIYSIQTRDANQIGDGVAARQKSRMARVFAHSALGVGLFVCTAYIVYLVLMLNML